MGSGRATQQAVAQPSPLLRSLEEAANERPQSYSYFPRGFTRVATSFPAIAPSWLAAPPRTTIGGKPTARRARFG